MRVAGFNLYWGLIHAHSLIPYESHQSGKGTKRLMGKDVAGVPLGRDGPMSQFCPHDLCRSL